MKWVVSKFLMTCGYYIFPIKKIAKVMIAFLLYCFALGSYSLSIPDVELLALQVKLLRILYCYYSKYSLEFN